MLGKMKSLGTSALFAAAPRLELPFEFYYQKLRNRLEEEMGLIKDLSGKGGVAIDVGANFGLYSFLLSKYHDRVEAFEPNGACLRALRAYNSRKIGINQVGLSSKSATAVLNVPRNATLHGFGSLNPLPDFDALQMPVPVARLDDFGYVGVSLIKVDVEGHELEVIRGARETLARERPTMLIEIEQRHLSFPIATVFAEVEALGYEGAFWTEGRYMPLSEFSVETHQSVKLLGQRGRKYVNNFIFRPVSSPAT
jgi:FkbM family methyltransferase